LEQMSGYQENWFPLVQEAYVKARVESVMSRNGVTSKDMLPKKLTGSHESIAAVLAETEASAKRARKRVMKMLEQDRKAREVAARQKAKNEQNAKQFWASLDEEQKSQVKRARSRSDKERVLSSFGADNSNIQVWFPLLLALYATEIGRPQTSSSYSSSSSDSSYRSSDSGSSFSSDFTSFGGGGFDGGGGGGSW